MKRVLMIGLALVLPVSGWTQSVNWSPSKGTFEKGTSARLSLVFKDCDPVGAIRIPQVQGLEIGQPNSRQSHITGLSGILSGKGKTTTLGMPVMATEEGQVIIPAFTIATSEGDLEVPEARYQVVKAAVRSQIPTSNSTQSPGPSLSLDDVAQARIEFERNEMWAGEVQVARLVLQGMSPYVKNFSQFSWDPAQLTRGPWLKHDEKRGVVDRNEVMIFEVPVRVQSPQQPGELSIDPARVEVIIQSSSSRRSPFDIFQSSGRPVTITGPAPPITVKPLPEAPQDFSGAVGEFSMTSQLVPKQAAVGEPLTWTVEIAGLGNWNQVITMPNRQVPEGFEVIQPKSNTEMEDESPFMGKITEDVVLIPTKAGTFTIPGLEFVFFDTQKGKYQTVKTAAQTITIEAAKSSPLSPGANSDPAAPPSTQSPVPAAQAQVVPFDGQPQLPREPLGVTLSSGRPFSSPAWVCWLVLPWIGVVLYWCWLAWKRVVQLDAGRSRREALHALKSWHSTQQGQAVSAVALRQWQREVEQLWQVSRPVPYSARLQQAVADRGGDGESWAWLWNACEGVLFGKEAQLPPDWHTRLGESLQQVRVPRVKLSGLLKPQVWLPLVMAVLLMAASGEAQENTDAAVLPDAEAVYQSGEFQKTEAALRLKLEQDWGDSAAHHDLALALFQQERWDEAAAHAAIAAVQSPGHEAILWDVRLLAERAGWRETVTGRFFSGDHLLSGIYTVRSVRFWQWVGMVASLTFALMVVWGLSASYRKVGAFRIVRWCLAIGAVVTLLISILCVERWGMLRHPDAVIVVEEVEARSIPSEVDQQTRPLPVGTIGYFQSEFLGWRKVVLPNSEEVWVREKEVLPFYKR